MGADLILATCPVPRWMGGKPVASFDQIGDQVMERIHVALSDEVKVAEMVDVSGMFSEDGLEIVERAVEAVRTVIDGYNSYRDMQMIGSYGSELIVSGGMSWGDTPTESYDDVWICDVLGIFGKPFIKPRWLNDEMQFARLIAEVEAAGGFTEALVQDLQTSMDLQEVHLMELIDRAQAHFDRIKGTLG